MRANHQRRSPAAESAAAEVLPPMSAIQRERYLALEIERVLSNAIDNLLRREADTTVRTVGPAHETLVVGRISHPMPGRQTHRHYLNPRAGRAASRTSANTASSASTAIHW
jgi:hypothetical protein